MIGAMDKGRMRRAFGRLRKDFHSRYTTTAIEWIRGNEKKVIRGPVFRVS